MCRKLTSVLTLSNLIFCSIVLLTSCTKRLNCDSTDNVFLGTTDYSDVFKEWSIESESDVLFFDNTNGDTIRLDAQSIVTDEPRWLIESVVCEEALDVKPFKAYAYYEYADKTQIFSTIDDEVLISIEPEIALNDDVRTESIFINFSTNAATSIKGQVPVTNAQSIPQSEPFGLHFSHTDAVQLGDRRYVDVWVLDQDELSIYYNDQVGIAALRLRDIIYHRI